MNKQQIQKALPFIALILAVIFGGVGVAISLRYAHFLLVLLIITALSFAGTFFPNLPRLECQVVLGFVTVLCLVVAPQWKYIVILSGVSMGYFWGNWVGDILDRHNVERARDAAQCNAPHARANGNL